MINRLDIIDEYPMKCDFILNTVIFIDAALNISFSFFEKGHTCNVLWFYLYGQGVPNETKSTINLKTRENAFIMRQKPAECINWMGSDHPKTSRKEM